MYGYGGYAPYVSVAEKKAKAKRALEKLKKSGKDLDPIMIEGTKIAKTWWGIAWNKNLESYADYENRIGRGRSYVRNGSVLDLKISSGKIIALVDGSGRNPYTIDIGIDELSKDKWESIIATCSRQIESISDLALGKFPKELESAFTEKGHGLFPIPKEIHFNCSCPDWASMCKHIAAALYGIGARLDDDPLLFFKMRGIDAPSLIKKSIEEKMKNMLEHADQRTSRVLDDDEVGDLFGL